jgi:Fic-DOC domain mobile mystery protein B
VTDEPGFTSGINLRALGLEPEGGTLIDDEDREGLLPDFLLTRADLNEVEYENIAVAYPWANRQARLRGPLGVLDYSFLFSLHKQMFQNVWKWAGTQRRRLTNLGVDPAQIPDQVRQALDDVRFWHTEDLFSADERAARIHHRLVTVHPFPNGNGRCTRLVADLYLVSIGEAPFTWGSGQGGSSAAIRAAYISALVAAPSDAYASLSVFGRS